MRCSLRAVYNDAVLGFALGENLVCDEPRFDCLTMVALELNELNVLVGGLHCNRAAERLFHRAANPFEVEVIVKTFDGCNPLFAVLDNTNVDFSRVELHVGNFGVL